MKRHILLALVVALGLLSVMVLCASLPGCGDARAKNQWTLFRRLYSRRLGQPPSRLRARSMSSVLLWENPTTAITAGPLTSGRREINWDGGGTNDWIPQPR